MAANSDQASDPKFQNKVWTIVGVVALTFILLFIFKEIFNVLLLVFAGALIAIYFHGLKGMIQRLIKCGPKVGMALAITVTVLLIGGFFWFAGDQLGNQIAQLKEDMPAMVDKLRERVQQHPIGSQVLERVTSKESQEKLEGVANTFFRSTFGVVGDLYVVILLGLFFTASPGAYVNGMIKLLPSKARDGGREVIGKIGITLAKWLKGMLFAMFFVAVLSAIALYILKIPMALSLAVLAGLLNFIPNFGPLLAMIPAALLALLVSPITALIVVIVYIGIQTVESSILTPQIQKKLIDIPPALIIIAQLVMGVLSGGIGLLLATPLMAMIMVIVQELYVKKQDEKS